MAERRDDEDDTPLLEWVFGVIGLVLFVGALVVTILNGMRPSVPPTIVVAMQASEASGGKFRVAFNVVNQGDETAARVQLSATLSEGGNVLETHAVEIDFLPPHASRNASVLFRRDPADLELAIEPVSYQSP
jgi:uncharacterized protein (TIGR02588 family)